MPAFLEGWNKWQDLQRDLHKGLRPTVDPSWVVSCSILYLPPGIILSSLPTHHATHFPKCALSH